MSKKPFTVAVRVKPIDNDDENKTSNVPKFINEAAKGFARYIFAPCTSQQDIFEATVAVPQLIKSYFSGVDCTLLAYGQTGSGKTHTIFGPPGCLTEASISDSGKASPNWGLFPRTALEILNTVNGTFKLSAWAVEVYLDRFYDLINQRKPVSIAGVPNKVKSSATRKSFDKIQYDSTGKWVMPKWGIKAARAEEYDVSGQSECVFQSPEDIIKFARLVETTRSTQSHDLNERSSRSHCVICLNLLLSVGSKKDVQSSRFLFVDLAGSERVSKSGSISDGRGRKKTGLRFDEARNVNTSLTALGRCVSALAEKKAHVPFRDSSLTMLLGQSLGGHSQTSVIVNVYENPSEYEETKASLRFGSCLSVVKVKTQTLKKKASVDSIRDKLNTQLTAIKAEIKSLKAQGHGGGIDQTFAKATVNGFLENKRRLEAAQTMIEQTKQDILEAKFTKNENDLCKAQERLEQAQHEKWVYEGLVLRQQTTGIYKEPSSLMKMKMTEKEQIEKELKRLDGF